MHFYWRPTWVFVADQNTPDNGTKLKFVITVPLIFCVHEFMASDVDLIHSDITDDIFRYHLFVFSTAAHFKRR
jgi:hypothetical protein